MRSLPPPFPSTKNFPESKSTSKSTIKDSDVIAVIRISKLKRNITMQKWKLKYQKKTANISIKIIKTMTLSIKINRIIKGAGGHDKKNRFQYKIKEDNLLAISATGYLFVFNYRILLCYLFNSIQVILFFSYHMIGNQRIKSSGRKYFTIFLQFLDIFQKHNEIFDQ